MHLSKNFISKSLLLHVLFALFFVVAERAHAKSGYGPVVTPAPNGFNVKFAKDGTPMAVPANSATGVTLAVPATVNLGPTTAAQIAATAGIAGAAMGGPWGAAIGAIGAVGVFAIPAFADAYVRAKMRLRPDGSIEASDPSVCTVAPCYAYKAGPGLDYPTALQACAAFVATVNPPATIREGQSETYCPYNITSFGVPGGNGATSIQKIDHAPYPVAYSPVTIAQAQSLISAQTPTADQVQALVDLDFPPDPGPVTITGPASVGSSNTVKTGLDGSRQEETCKFYLEYFPSNIAVHPECTTTTTTPEKTETKQVTKTNPDGSTTTQTVTTTTPASTTTSSVVKDKLPDPVACGLPGTPACKLDESGTPDYDPAKMQLDKAKLDADSAAQRNVIRGEADKGMFSQFGSLFVLPSLRACEPLQLPVYSGYALPSMDICPGAEWLRGLMGFVWAAAGLAFCFRSVQGVI